MTKVILIAGAAGTSKSSTARSICSELKVSHRLGSGFIREIARAFVSENENPSLYRYSFRPVKGFTPFENLYEQSKILTYPMERCMRRASAEGSSLVIEGVNVIPGQIDCSLSSHKLLLTVPDETQHREMICGETHADRVISDEDFKNVRQIQDSFIEAATNNNWRIFEINSFQKLYEEVFSYIRG